ncbi:MAG: hypothetical protein J6O51_08840 [Bacteroidales bacterium]|nr:hypothetical protein [Bacteroidales bacterium]
MNAILNLSGAFQDESWDLEGSRWLDFRSLEACCCYCSEESAAILRSRLATETKAGVCWTDTGDYHYISLFRMEQIKEPFALCLFDNHPDDEEDSLGSGMLSCGNWVKFARESLPLMKSDFRNTTDIPGDTAVFLSIDLDVLSADWARTDWSQGDMTLQELLEALDIIRASHRILAVDICGGLTVAKGAKPADLSINTRTRNILASYFDSHPPVAG